MLLALLLLAAPETPPRTLAVLEFKSKLQPDDIDVGYLTDVVRTAAKDAVPNLRLITRENLLVLLGASGKKPEDCEGDCEVETGRRVGADLVISGEALKFGSNYKINMKMHDTQTGELLSGAQATGADLDELDRNLNEAVAKLLAPVGATGVPRPLNQTLIPARSGGAPPLFGFGAHASIGYHFDSTSSSGTSVAASSGSSFMYGVGADAEVRVVPQFGVGPFVDLTILHFASDGARPASSPVAVAVGGLGRFRAGSGAVFAGVGYTAADNGNGLFLQLGGELAIFGPLAARAALTYRSLSKTSTLAAVGGGITTDETSVKLVGGEVGLGILF